jgi:hypothetical protein
VRTLLPLLALLLLLPALGRAEDPVPSDDDDSAGVSGEPTPEPTPSLPPAANERLMTARILVDRLARLDEQVTELRARRNVEFGSEERTALSTQLTALQQERADAEADLQRLVTGLDLSWIALPPTSDFKFEDELADLLAPIVQELKGATARPRKIEQLRILIAHYEERVPRLAKSLTDLTDLGDLATSPPVREAIAGVREAVLEQQRLLDEQISIAKHELTLLESQRKSLVESGADVARVFFRNRGRNLVASLLALLLTVAGVRLAHRGVMSVAGPKTPDDATFVHRLVDLAGYVLAVLGGLIAMLLVLYASGDWVLLTIAGIALLGISLGARQGIPRIWEEIKLLLNLGTVRQGERVLYMGVPWRVARLNLLTRLENPAFPHAPLRLPLRQLHDLRSRPYAPDEPWFPCVSGDWLWFPGGGIGRVRSVSPDFVEVVIDESVRAWPTAEFLGLAPSNLSGGFRHVVTVTLDYMHQGQIVTEIPERLRAWLHHRIGDRCERLVVEYESAQASSLDVRVEAWFPGELAPTWRALRREMEGAVVEACNEYRWEIALPQVVVHKPPGGGG